MTLSLWVALIALAVSVAAFVYGEIVIRQALREIRQAAREIRECVATNLKDNAERR